MKIIKRDESIIKRTKAVDEPVETIPRAKRRIYLPGKPFSPNSGAKYGYRKRKGGLTYAECCERQKWQKYWFYRHGKNSWY